MSDYPSILHAIAARINEAMEGGDPETAAEVRRIAAQVAATADDLLAALDEEDDDDDEVSP